MEAHLAKAARRAGLKLGVGLACLGALVGIRMITATPAGLGQDLAELDRLDAELAAVAEPASTPAPHDAGRGDSTGARMDAPDAAAPPAGEVDRLVRCHLGRELQYMRAGDCANRGGGLEELPPPEPEAAATPDPD